MCIVFFKYRLDARYPIMLGANREENAKRHSLGFTQDKHLVWAGLDYGPTGDSPDAGTWLGCNLETGLLVAVTNRDDGFQDGVNSRGTLCHSLIEREKSPEAAVEAITDLLNLRKHNIYSAANYIVLSPKSGYVVQAPDKDHIECIRVRKGVHAITTLNFDDPNDERIKFVKTNLTETGSNGHFLDAAAFLCAHKNIVIDDQEWGTVSSAIIQMNEYETTIRSCKGFPTSSASYREDVCLRPIGPFNA